MIVTVEGLWGAGKSTTARLVAERIESRGLATALVHYGPLPDVLEELSSFLTHEPLRLRSGAGGYRQPHHASVDVFLRLCREAHHHTVTYPQAALDEDVVIVDHGVYSKLAYAVTVLAEQHPEVPTVELLRQVQAVVQPWFLTPDRAFYLDVPWPTCRERAVERGYGAPHADSVERLLFLPRYDRVYRQVCRAFPRTVTRIVPGSRDVAAVADLIEREILTALAPPSGKAP